LLPPVEHPRDVFRSQAGINYYRYLDDYVSLRKELVPGKSVVIAGGGFIGSEMAAVLSACGVGVTMVVPERYLCASVSPCRLELRCLPALLVQGSGY